MVDLAALQSEEGLEIVPGVRVRLRSLGDYRQNEQNPVSHTPHNLGVIVESIQKVGAARSGLAADGTIYAGNLTSEAMAIAGIEGIIEVTTDGRKWVMVNRPDLTPEQRKQAAHGDQWSAMLAEMNVDQLLADIEAGVDLDGIYSEFDLEAILGEALVEVETGEAPEPKLDKGAELAEKYGVQVGQVWQLGEHRLAVGDCTDRAVVDVVMRGEKAQLIVTSPPYPGADMWSEEEEEPQERIERLDKLSAAALRIIWDILDEGGVCCWDVQDIPFGNHGVITTTTTTTTTVAVKEIGYSIRGRIIWDKAIPHLPSPAFMRRPCVPNMTHEDILILFKGDWIPREKKSGLSDEAKSWLAQGVWRIATESAKAKGHPAPFPIELAIRLISLFSLEGDVVYEPFIGSGTTGAACQKLGRQARMIEIKPEYCAITIQRLADMGLEPKLLE